MAQSVRTARDVVVAVALFLAWSPAHAKPPAAATVKAVETGDPFDAARDAEARLDYKSAIANATAALDMANSHERLLKIYELLGTSYGVLGRTEDSVDAFTRLLAIDPDHRLPRGLSPKVTRPFKEAGGYWLDRPGGLAVVPTMPREVSSGKAVSVAVKLEDPLQMAANVRLSYRQEGTPDYTKLETPIGPSITFNIPAETFTARPADYSVELYVTALSAKGGELRSAGDAAHPLLITVRASREPLLLTGGDATVKNNPVVEAPAAKKPSILKKWWLWTAVAGVVVVAGALGGGLGYYYSRDTSHVDFSISSRTAP